MTQEKAKLRKNSIAYNIFILVLTILSLAVMVVLLMNWLSCIKCWRKWAPEMAQNNWIGFAVWPVQVRMES